MCIKFNELPLVDKALIVKEFATVVESIQYYEYWVHLYSLHRNFIEVYHNTHTNQIDRISMVLNADIDKYLAKISLNALKI